MNQIQLKKETKQNLVSGVKGFFLDQRDEEIGDLQAELLIDFLIDKIGPEVYNQALADASQWFKGRLVDLEIDYYVLEKQGEEK